MKLFQILFFTFTSFAFSQTSSITGKIQNQENGLPISFVNIGVEGTYFGTSSDENGKFKLLLKKGSHNLLISSVGFETKRIEVTVPTEEVFLIKLKPITIELPEVIVNSDENPAYAIIRQAIVNKEKNKEGLSNYYYNFYSKNIMQSGKDIVFLEEDIGEGFNNVKDSVAEFKTHIHKTKNLDKDDFQKGDLNFLDQKVMDFTDDSLEINNSIFHLPLSQFAFNYYDYELLGIQRSGKRNFYQIKIIPRSKILPTFSGEILIDDSSYALTGLNLTLESRNLMPFTEVNISLIQNLINYKNYWLPKYYNADVEFNFNAYHLVTLDSLITSYRKVFNNYSINLDENNSLLRNINLLSDTTFDATPKTITQIEIDSVRLYPLALDEISAYEKIDSSNDIASSIKIGGILKDSGIVSVEKDGGNDSDESDEDSFPNIFEYINLQNNRVDGIVLGLKYSYSFSKGSNLSLETSYAFARKDVEAKLSFYIPIKKSFIDGMELSGNYETKPFHTFSHYSEFMNSVAVTFGFEDQFNYIHSKGGSVAIKKQFSKNTFLKFGFTLENQKSVDAIKYYSIFNSKRYVRPNPIITDGMNNRVVLNFNSGANPYEINFETTDGFVSQIEFSSKVFGSKFEYARISTAYQLFTKTFFEELFFSPYLGIFIEANAIVGGSYGVQHLHTPQTALGVYSPFGSFKGLAPYQLVGEKSIALHLEHNWRKTFFDMLGIYFPVAWNLELVTGVSGLGIWKKENILLKNNFSNYWEFYGGITGILGVVNINVSYNKIKDTVVRFGFSKMF
ncbi:MAG: DUF5686 family protein [Melioribacteraceae bacterium]